MRPMPLPNSLKNGNSTEAPHWAGSSRRLWISLTAFCISAGSLHGSWPGSGGRESVRPAAGSRAGAAQQRFMFAGPKAATADKSKATDQEYLAAVERGIWKRLRRWLRMRRRRGFYCWSGVSWQTQRGRNYFTQKCGQKSNFQIPKKLKQDCRRL